MIIETDLLIRSMGQISESGMVKNFTVKHLLFGWHFYLTHLWCNRNCQNMRPRKTISNLVTQLAMNGHILSILVSVSINQRKVLRRVTLKGKNMLPIRAAINKGYY